MNHTMMAAVLMCGIWLAVCLPAVAVVMKSGPMGRAAGLVLLAAGVVSPWILAIFLEAGYVDNGCLGTLLLLGAYAGGGWAARHFGAGEPARTVVAVGASIVAPWLLYGGIGLIEFLRRPKKA